jgi:hypothetical protein
VDTVTDLIEQACDHLMAYEGCPGKSDIAAAIRCMQIARGRFDQSPINRAARLLYQEMDSWATFEKGVVRPEVIVQLLAQEGLLREMAPQEEI